jgi:hypothetical protein
MQLSSSHGKIGEPSVATEPGLRDSTNGQSTIPAR